MCNCFKKYKPTEVDELKQKHHQNPIRTRISLLFNSYSIIGVLKDLLTGKAEFADKYLQKFRLAECKYCEYKTNVFGQRCTICGCFLKAKVKFQKSKCPIEKW